MHVKLVVLECAVIDAELLGVTTYIRERDLR